MRKIFVSILYLIGMHSQGQGIKFEQPASWQQILTLAKSENKYVFVDCFATWCGPCKYLAKQIFPQPQVGDFMNERFINYSMQMDSTVHDVEELKLLYPEVKVFMKTFNITAFPTLLFFSPEGELIYQYTGDFGVASSFIDVASKALDKDEQYFFMLNEYNEGKNDLVFLKGLLKRAIEQGDDKIAATLKIKINKTSPKLLDSGFHSIDH